MDFYDKQVDVWFTEQDKMDSYVNQVDFWSTELDKMKKIAPADQMGMVENLGQSIEVTKNFINNRGYTGKSKRTVIIMLQEQFRMVGVSVGFYKPLTKSAERH